MNLNNKSWKHIFRLPGVFLYAGESMYSNNESDTSAGIKLAAKKSGGSN